MVSMAVTGLTGQTWSAFIVSGLMTGKFKGSKAGFWAVTDRAVNSVLVSLRVAGQTDSSILDILARADLKQTDSSTSD